jgi:hypothetical protein
MTGKSNDPRQPRLARAPQLWRLNQLGRLRLVEHALPIRSFEAETAIGAELDKLGLSRWFPRTGERLVRQA